MYLFYVPFPDLKTARTLSQKAIESKLCACANLFPPITSFYLWGETNAPEKLEESQEIPVLFKVASPQKEAFQTFLEKEHPYACPAILCVKAEANHLFHAWAQRFS